LICVCDKTTIVKLFKLFNFQFQFSVSLCVLCFTSRQLALCYCCRCSCYSCYCCCCIFFGLLSTVASLCYKSKLIQCDGDGAAGGQCATCRRRPPRPQIKCLLSCCCSFPCCGCCCYYSFCCSCCWLFNFMHCAFC